MGADSFEVLRHRVWVCDIGIDKDIDALRVVFPQDGSKKSRDRMRIQIARDIADAQARLRYRRALGKLMDLSMLFVPSPIGVQGVGWRQGMRSGDGKQVVAVPDLAG